MSYRQVIAPDLNTVGDVGWCLKFVEEAFHDLNYSYATARDGWDACRFIHRDQNLPNDVCVPIWFDYYESGINYGHVAIWVPGKGILSSPWRADGTQQWEPDIATISRVYNSTYLGWSEDLMGVRVIEGVNDMALNAGDLQNINKAWGWPGHPISDADIAYWVNGTGNTHFSDPKGNIIALFAEVIDYVKQHNSQVSKQTVLDYLNAHLT